MFPVTVEAQTTISGNITSLNGLPIPNVIVEPKPQIYSTVFDDFPSVIPEENGEYEITFQESGIYTIEIKAVFHRTAHIRVIIFDQDNIDMDIRLVPVAYNNGRNFDKKSYTDWIRVFGNFNNYDYFSGEIFTQNPDSSISATIPASADTIHYQVRGLRYGPAPLPDEPHTSLRDNDTFEGIIVPAADTDSIELRYDPRADRQFTRKIPGDVSQEHINLNIHRALLSFKNPSDYYWFEPVYLVNRTSISVTRLKKRNVQYDLEIEDDKFNIKPMDGFFGYSAAKANRQRLRIRHLLENENLHHQQRAAYYIAYLGLLAQEVRYTKGNSDQEPDIMNSPGIDFLKKITETVHPRHPLWSYNHDAAVQLLQFSNFNANIVKYARQMVRDHENDMVVRKLTLEMIKNYAVNFDHYSDMPEYKMVVERYGENNLARKAIEEFARARMKEGK